MIEVQRISAFAYGDVGGNPAGVALLDALPGAETMQRVAAEIGYSETAFAAPHEDGFRVRYFAPEMEAPFCGHATIATGAALGAKFGAAVYPLHLNDAAITVEAIRASAGGWAAALQSPPTRSAPAPEAETAPILEAFELAPGDLDPAFPLRIAEAGARHLVIVLARRERLGEMRYPFEAVKALMAERALTTISLLTRERDALWHARNPFASGGVVEDPATGAAAAAFAGYLRDLGALPTTPLEIVQGEDMGMRSRLKVEATPEPGASVRVSGATRHLAEPTRFDAAA